MSFSRRQFLGSSTAAMAAAAAIPQAAQAATQDGPAGSGFSPVELQGNTSFEDLANRGVSEAMAKAAPRALRGRCVCWGVPFEIDRPILLADQAVTESLGGLKAGWLVFQHAADGKPLKRDERGFIHPMRGEGHLAEHIADYVIVYTDGTEVREEIRRRHQAGAFTRPWGENCFQAVAHRKPHPIRPLHEQPSLAVDAGVGCGRAETRTLSADSGSWVNWLWAWENPHSEKEIVSLRFEPRSGALIISGISAGQASSQPLRWRTRRKAVLELPEGIRFDEAMDTQGRWPQVQLDMGQVISIERRKLYPNAGWGRSYNNKLPEVSRRDLIVEYTAHPDARFHLWDGTQIPVSRLEQQRRAGPLARIAEATHKVQIRVVDKSTGKPVPVKLHIHGKAGEDLPPRRPPPAAQQLVV